MRRAILTLLALAVFLPATAIARAQATCSFDRLVREACCVPRQTHAPVRGPTLQRECCTIVKHGATAPPVATEASPQPVPAPVAVIIATTPVLPPLRVVYVVDVAPRAPPLERSLFTQHCALLV